MLYGLVLSFFIVLFNAFFVAAEFAIVKIRASQIELKASAGNKLAKLAKHIIERLDAYLAASQIGITIASLALGWVAEGVISEMVERHFPETASGDGALLRKVVMAVSFGVLSTVHIVFGEQAPKYIAIRHPEVTTMAVAIPLRGFYFIFRPFIGILDWMTNTTLALFGVAPVQAHETHTEAELRMLLEQGSRQGAIQSSEHELIEKVFSFDDRILRQIMVPRARMCIVDIAASPQDLLEIIAKEGYSRLPVKADAKDNIAGIIHSKDLLPLVFEGKAVQLKTLLRPAYFVPETKKIGDLLREFQRKRIHMAIVIDEFGATSGLVTLEDIVEELVGEIQDEYDEESPVVEKRNEDEFWVNAFAPIIDVNKHLPVPLPERADYASVAGMLNMECGVIPEAGQKVVHGGYEITVLKRSKRNVESVIMKLLGKADEGDHRP